MTNDQIEARLEFERHESDVGDGPWERWCARVERLIGHDLDGDNSAAAKMAGCADGYSIDDAVDWWASGMTAVQAAAHVIANRRPDHKFSGNA